MLEIACFNLHSVYAAANAGADQIELCADYSAGGVTPPTEWVTALHAKSPGVPVKVMIRPRGGDFNYTQEEFEEMRQSIDDLRGCVGGFVFGILDGDGTFDEVRNRELVGLAHPIPCTFHRAIDGIAAWESATEAIVKCGFKSILIGSGVDRTARLQSRFGADVLVLHGGGVRSSNIEEARRASGAWIHSSALTGTGEDVDVDVEEVRRMKEVLVRVEEEKGRR